MWRWLLAVWSPPLHSLELSLYFSSILHVRHYCIYTCIYTILFLNWFFDRCIDGWVPRVLGANSCSATLYFHSFNVTKLILWIFLFIRKNSFTHLFLTSLWVGIIYFLLRSYLESKQISSNFSSFSGGIRLKYFEIISRASHKHSQPHCVHIHCLRSVHPLSSHHKRSGLLHGKLTAAQSLPQLL